MQERHAEFDVVVRMATQAIHLLAHDGSSVRERVVHPPVDVLARFGDPTPVRLDTAGRTAAEIVGDALAEEVEDSLRGQRVLVIAPDAWGLHRHDLITALLSGLGARPSICPETDFLLSYRDAAQTEEDRTLWVRVGSELTTAALVHREQGHWVQHHRVEFNWGGDDIDDRLVRFVSRRLPESIHAESLRTACREARERLSDQVTAAVVISAGSVYLHRKDVEELAAPSARAALTSTLGQVLALSDRAATTVLISGGTARTPLVAQLASEISGQPIGLVDWRDTATPLLLRPTVVAVSVDRDDLLPSTVRPGPERRPTRTSRRRVPFLAAVAGGVAVLAFATVGASQIGGGASLMRGILGDNSASVPGSGPPGAYAATQTPEPASSAAPGSPFVLTDSVATGQAGRTPGVSLDPSGAPGGAPPEPGVPAAPANPAPGDPTNPPAPTNAPAPPAPAPAPAPSAPVPSAPAPRPTADPPPPTSVAPPPPTSAPPPTSDAPPPTDAPTPVESSTPADPTPSSDPPAAVDSATPDTSAP